MQLAEISKFDIHEKIVKSLQDQSIVGLYQIQAETYAHIKEGKDVIALAKTGSGKTLAYAIPVIDYFFCLSEVQQYGRPPRALVLAPTRELVNQIASVFTSISQGSISILPVYGGVAYNQQVKGLRLGTDVIVATPGRVKDLIGSNRLNLKSVKFVILDEVDRMLDMGFSADVEEILTDLYNNEDGSIKKPQTLLFSATLPAWVSEISAKYTSKDCFRLSLVSPSESRTSDTVEHLALLCPYYERASAISDIIRIYSHGPVARCIVFCEKKKDADELSSHSLMSSDCHVFHGDIPQDKRELILQKFREGKYRTLITTNVAARGLDIPTVDLVIQCAPPSTPEDYIHRSGRTGRAGRKGVSVCFFTVKQKQQLAYIERGAGVVFRRISAPSTDDLIQVYSHEWCKSFQEIPELVWRKFLPSAEQITTALLTGSTFKDSEDSSPPAKRRKKSKKSSPEETEGDVVQTTMQRALCCALANIAGKLELENSRSVLTSQSKRTAYKLCVPSHISIQRKGFAYCILNKQLPVEVTESLESMAFLKGRTGFVFDMPDNQKESIEKLWTDYDGFTLEKLTSVPELEPEADDFVSGERKPSMRSGRWSSRGQSRSGFSRGRGLSRSNGHGGMGSRTSGRGQRSFRGRRNFLRGGDSSTRTQINGFRKFSIDIGGVKDSSKVIKLSAN